MSLFLTTYAWVALEPARPFVLPLSLSSDGVDGRVCGAGDWQPVRPKTHLMGIRPSDASEKVLDHFLGVQVGVADARNELREGHQPHIQRQCLYVSRHDVYHLRARGPLLHSPSHFITG